LGTPQVLDDFVERHYLVRAQEQERKEDTLLMSAERKGTALVGHLERTENPELHACLHVCQDRRRVAAREAKRRAEPSSEPFALNLAPANRRK
jgi:hypothetical protein